MEHNRLIAYNSVSSRSPQTMEDSASNKKLTQFSIESILSERNSPSVGTSTKPVTLFSNSPFQSSSSSSSCSPSLPSLTPPSTPVSTSPSSNGPSISFTEKITPSSLPIGIAVARQRKSKKSSWPLSPVKQDSGRKTTDSVPQRFHTKCQLEASHSPQPPISPLPESFYMGTLNSLDTFHQNRIKTEKSKKNEVGTPTVTLPPDYRLARDSLTGQLFLHLLPSNCSYNPSTVGSIPNEPPLSIQPVNQNVAWLPCNVPPLPSNGSSSSAIYPVSTCSPSIEEACLRHSHSQPVCKHEDFSPFRTEIAIQACMSDEESDNLMISESPPPSDSSDKITSACQADMDAGVRTVSDTCEETRELIVKTMLDSDPEVPYDFSDIHPKNDIWTGSSTVKSEASFNLDSESQSVPTLPVRSEEVINFINNRGLDRLVDSIESLSEFDCDTKVNTTPAINSFTKNVIKTQRKTKIPHEYSKERTSQSIPCNEGLKLLSALAEQRSLEEKTSAKSLRRHSVDCEKSLNNDNPPPPPPIPPIPPPILPTSSKDQKNSTMQRLAKRRNRSESCISAISASEAKSSLPSHSTNKTVAPILEGKESTDKREDLEQPVKRKRKDSSTSSFDPWMIRRSERIFLHESYAQSGLPIPDARRELFEKTPSRKSKSRRETSPASEFESSLENNPSGEPPDFKVTLKNDERVLVNLDSLFYAGSISSMKEPDNMFLVTLDGVKIQNRHHYSKEDLLKLTLKEVKPQSCDQLPPGTRVCAFWAGQQKCLYAGKVVNNPSPYPMEEDVVFVEFDDGDKGSICIRNIRLLPSDFPIQKEDDGNYKKSRRLRDKDKSEMSKNDNSLRKASKKQESIVEKEKKSNSRESPTKNSQLHKSKNYRTDQSKQLLIKSKQNLDGSKNAEKPPKKKTKIVEEDTSDSNGLNEAQLNDDDSRESKKNKSTKKTMTIGHRQKSPSSEVDRTIELLPERELWEWNDKPFKRVNGKSKYRKFYHREIVRGDEVIKLGDCAIFISTGRPNLPYVGRIDSMWESGSGNMIVRVRWFYHPEETKTQPDLVDPQGALFESRHYDENDIQTISHRCSVLRWVDYQVEIAKEPNTTADPTFRIYYFGGDYDPLSGKIHLAAGVPLQKP